MAVVPGRKAGQAALKAAPEVLLPALGDVGLARLSCPSQEGNQKPALWCGRWWEALALLHSVPGSHFPSLSFHLLHLSTATWTCVCFPDTFSVLPSPLLSLADTQDPREALQRKEGRGTGSSSRSLEAVHEVPFVTPCAFDQPVKGSSRAKKIAEQCS